MPPITRRQGDAFDGPTAAYLERCANGSRRSHSAPSKVLKRRRAPRDERVVHS